MDVETRDPFESRVQSLNELLLHKIVDANVSLSLFKANAGYQRRASSFHRAGERKADSNKEVWPRRVECDSLNVTLHLAERRLGLVLRQLVDQDRSSTGCYRAAAMRQGPVLLSASRGYKGENVPGAETVEK